MLRKVPARIRSAMSAATRTIEAESRPGGSRRHLQEWAKKALLFLSLLLCWEPALAQQRSDVPGIFSGTDNLGAQRSRHTATLLPNGRILVAGGLSGTVALASAELLDPTTETWVATVGLIAARYHHTATLLPNGKVLVAGGHASSPLASAELYDPVIGTWTATGNLTNARELHTATLLTNGKVLVTGGNQNGKPVASAELYDPATGTWTVTGNLGTARALHTATLLPNGKVLVAGGFDATLGASGYLTSAELYDPTTGMWSATHGLTTARFGHTATLLRNGEVLVTGGLGSGGDLASAELYGSFLGTWTATGSLLTARQQHTATLLFNGEVLVVGGTGTGKPTRERGTLRSCAQDLGSHRQPDQCT